MNARVLIEQEPDDKDEVLAGRPPTLAGVLANHGLRPTNNGEYKDRNFNGETVHHTEYTGLRIKLKHTFDRYFFAGYSERKDFDTVEIKCSTWVRPSSYAVMVTVDYGGKSRIWRSQRPTEQLIADRLDALLYDLESFLARIGSRTFGGLDRSLALRRFK